MDNVEQYDMLNIYVINSFLKKTSLVYKEGGYDNVVIEKTEEYSDNFNNFIELKN